MSKQEWPNGQWALALYLAEFALKKIKHRSTGQISFSIVYTKIRMHIVDVQ